MEPLTKPTGVCSPLSQNSSQVPQTSSSFSNPADETSTVKLTGKEKLSDEEKQEAVVHYTVTLNELTEDYELILYKIDVNEIFQKCSSKMKSDDREKFENVIRITYEKEQEIKEHKEYVEKCLKDFGIVFPSTEACERACKDIFDKFIIQYRIKKACYTGDKIYPTQMKLLIEYQETVDRVISKIDTRNRIRKANRENFEENNIRFREPEFSELKNEIEQLISKWNGKFANLSKKLAEGESDLAECQNLANSFKQLINPAAEKTEDQNSDGTNAKINEVSTFETDIVLNKNKKDHAAQSDDENAKNHAADTNNQTADLDAQNLDLPVKTLSKNNRTKKFFTVSKLLAGIEDVGSCFAYHGNHGSNPLF